MKAFSLVFLDGSGVNTNLTRRYGRAQGKERVKDSAPLNTPKSYPICFKTRIYPSWGAANGLMMRLNNILSFNNMNRMEFEAFPKEASAI